ARRCCAVSTARSRAAATTNLARLSQSLVLSARFFCAAAKSLATLNVFMICPPGGATSRGSPPPLAIAIARAIGRTRAIAIAAPIKTVVDPNLHHLDVAVPLDEGVSAEG